VSLIVLEATGGFETTVAAAVAGASLPLAVVNPRPADVEARRLQGLRDEPGVIGRRLDPLALIGALADHERDAPLGRRRGVGDAKETRRKQGEGEA